MKFSIVIPIYNAAQYMDECIQSVLDQSFRDFELILVDDGSKDESPSKCDIYQKKDSRVKVIHKSNGGPTSARKAGALMAVGEYILCLDSDDFVGADYLEYSAKQIDKYTPDCLCFGYNTIDTGDIIKCVNNLVDEGIYCGEELENITTRLLYDNEHRGNNSGSLLVSIWSKVIKREIFVESQVEIPDNMFFGEDIVLSVKCIKRSRALFVSKCAFYYYRITENSITNRYNPKKLEQIELTTKQLLQEMGEMNSLNVFCLYSLLGEIYNAAQNISLIEYRKVVKSIPIICSVAYRLSTRAKIYNNSWKDDIKKVFYKGKQYTLLFLLFRKRI